MPLDLVTLVDAVPVIRRTTLRDSDIAPRPAPQNGAHGAGHVSIGTNGCAPTTNAALTSSSDPKADRELYLPEERLADRERCRRAGIPDEVTTATKAVLAQRMCSRAVEAGVPFGWVTGDEAHGVDTTLRMWLKQKTSPMSSRWRRTRWWSRHS